LKIERGCLLAKRKMKFQTLMVGDSIRKRDHQRKWKRGYFLGAGRKKGAERIKSDLGAKNTQPFGSMGGREEESIASG